MPAGCGKRDLGRADRCELRAAAIANVKRWGFGDAYRSLDSTSGEMALFLASPRRAPTGPADIAASATPAPPTAAAERTRGGRVAQSQATNPCLLSCRLVDATGHRVIFTCDDQAVDIECESGESLLTVLRERLGVTSVKDGCAPQGQCGCCTVLVDGDPRVACVTPVERVTGRVVTTLSGLDPELRDRLAAAFVATGGSQCGFCTPGILVRTAALIDRSKISRTDIDRALAAHLCRCTGWQTIYEAIESVVAGDASASAARCRDLDAASVRAELEGGVAQQVGIGVPLGVGGFADDGAPHDALVAVPLAPGSDPEAAGAIEAFGVHWVVGETLADAWDRAGKVQGRRTTLEEAPPLALAATPRRWRTARDELGGARVPRTRRVVVRTGRRTGVTAGERRRVRREGRIARAGCCACACRSARTHGASGVLT